MNLVVIVEGVWAIILGTRLTRVDKCRSLRSCTFQRPFQTATPPRNALITLSHIPFTHFCRLVVELSLNNFASVEDGFGWEVASHALNL